MPESQQTSFSQNWSTGAGRGGGGGGGGNACRTESSANPVEMIT